MNKKHYPLFILTILLSGCNNVLDIQEPDTEIVPESTISVIKAQYPDAGQFVFKTLLKEKLWKTRFSSQANTFETNVSPSAISGEIFKNSSDSRLYNEVTNQLKIAGGIFSNVQVIDKAADNAARMKYVLNGQNQLLSYYLLSDWHVIKLTAPYPVESYHLDILDLPETIKSFCEQHRIDITESDITVNEDEAGRKTFIIHQQAELFPIFFDQDGNLQWIAKNTDGTPLENQINENVGNPELLNKVKTGFTDFNVANSLAFETKFNNLTSIRYVFQKKTGEAGTRDFISETKEVFVNANSGEVIFEQYSSYVFQ